MDGVEGGSAEVPLAPALLLPEGVSEDPCLGGDPLELAENDKHEHGEHLLAATYAKYYTISCIMEHFIKTVLSQ